MTATVHLICGRICSGKSHYAAALREKEGGVILGCDEFTLLLPDLGSLHDEVTGRLRALLMEKAAEIALNGCPVILDWGFWQAAYRRDTTAYFRGRGVPVRWHYIAAGEDALRRHIEARNAAGTGYYVDEGLYRKCLSLFEAPAREEMDEWIVPEA